MNKKKLAIALIPLVLLVILVIAFSRNLNTDKAQKDSEVIVQKVPTFKLASLHNPEKIYTQDDLPKTPYLLNVWATWCPSCYIEHPYLVKFANQVHVPMIGINYKDERSKALAYLHEGGDPYLFSVADENSLLAVDLGVIAAPETFVVDHQGNIRYRHLGVVDDRVWQSKILPLLKKLNAEAKDTSANSLEPTRTVL